MVYVITGATSFIGLELINYLHQNGEEVIAVCRSNSNKLSAIPTGVKIVHAVMDEYANLHQVIPHADIFINLAWEGTGHSGRDITDIQNNNIKNTLEAMISSQKMGCKLFVESGSQAEYGSVETVISEKTECHPFSEYGKAKLSVKEKCFKYSEKLRIKYIHLRVFSIFGENDHPWTLIMSSIDKMLKNENIQLSSCEQNWNFLYIKDAVYQITELCKYAITNSNFKHEVFNIASKDTRKLKEFVEKMMILSDSKSVLEYGVIKPEHKVSLNPIITKTEDAIGNIATHKFEEIIKNIINIKRTLL